MGVARFNHGGLTSEGRDKEISHLRRSSPFLRASSWRRLRSSPFASTSSSASATRSACCLISSENESPRVAASASHDSFGGRPKGILRQGRTDTAAGGSMSGIEDSRLGWWMVNRAPPGLRSRSLPTTIHPSEARSLLSLPPFRSVDGLPSGAHSRQATFTTTSTRSHRRRFPRAMGRSRFRREPLHLRGVFAG